MLCENARKQNGSGCCNGVIAAALASVSIPGPSMGPHGPPWAPMLRLVDRNWPRLGRPSLCTKPALKTKAYDRSEIALGECIRGVWWVLVLFVVFFIIVFEALGCCVFQCV